MPNNTMQELREIRLLMLEIEKDRERLLRLREQIGFATSGIRESSSRGAANPDLMAEQVSRLVDIERELFYKVAGAEVRVSDAEKKLDALQGAQRLVLRLRYFEGYDWRQVARTMHYTPRRCMQIHEEGVGNLV